MRKLTTVSVLVFAVCAASGASATELWWQNYNAWLDHEGNGIHIGLIQLVEDVDQDGVDDPIEYLIETYGFAGFWDALEDWIAGGCLPVDDDVLISGVWNPTHFDDYGDPAYDGYFGASNYSITFEATGTGDNTVAIPKTVYTRAFDSEHPTHGDWYGEIGDDEGNETFVLMPYPSPTFDYADYKFGTGVLQTDKVIPPWPEPSMILAGVFAVLLAYFKRKR